MEELVLNARAAYRRWRVAVAAGVLSTMAAMAAVSAPLAPPGDVRLRHDLELLNDSGVIDITLSAWPVALGDVYAALQNLRRTDLDAEESLALERVRRRLDHELETDDINISLRLSGSENPRQIRTFEATPREDGEVEAALEWMGERFAFHLAATAAANALDGDEFRPDGTYVGVALGNWIVTAGWQDRWYGPGRDGSLIMSNNARPTPGLMIQRNNSTAFESPWLSWIGPWTVTSFMSLLDDERTINDAWLFGFRTSARPLPGFEIGITRTAQWCGDDRPCDLGTFVDLLLGNDNRGVNVVNEDEPGNQLGGYDLRWALPGDIPVALYVQWIGEDGRDGAARIGSWLRQAGVELWGTVGEAQHRTHFEIADTLCREGGLGFSDAKPDCAYGHSIYRTGYRYRNRSIGHSMDSDGLSYSVGSTLVQSAGHTWNATLRYMEINREGAADVRHTLSATPREIIDLQVTYRRETRFGTFYAGLGHSRVDDELSGSSEAETSGFLQWSSW